MVERRENKEDTLVAIGFLRCGKGFETIQETRQGLTLVSWQTIRVFKKFTIGVCRTVFVEKRFFFCFCTVCVLGHMTFPVKYNCFNNT